MYETAKGIVLHVLKYSDKNSIAHIYTDIHGKMSYFIPQGSTRSARMRNAIFLPLSIIEFESRSMPGRDIALLKDCHAARPMQNIYADPVKSAIAMFISELLSHAIQETERNLPLFNFIAQSIETLDNIVSGTANFHICFLYKLGTFLGIQPDTATYRKNYWFDMNNGIFTPSRPSSANSLPPRDAAVMLLLSRMNFHNLHLFKFNREQRNEILDIALSYYRIHSSTIGTLRSPDILRTLFL